MSISIRCHHRPCLLVFSFRYNADRLELVCKYRCFKRSPFQRFTDVSVSVTTFRSFRWFSPSYETINEELLPHHEKGQRVHGCNMQHASKEEGLFAGAEIILKVRRGARKSLCRRHAPFFLFSNLTLEEDKTEEHNISDC